MIEIVDIAIVAVEMIEDDQRWYWGSRKQQGVPETHTDFATNNFFSLSLAVEINVDDAIWAVGGYSWLSIPVLNIVRVGRDIIRYLLFCLLPIRYGKIVHHIVCNKKTADIWNICRKIARYWPINRPIWNNLFIARLRANIHYFLLSLKAYYIIFIR